MPLRLLAFLPPAMLITALILVSASSLVSAIDTKLTPASPERPPLQVQRYETTCDVLHREVYELARHATPCARDLRCLGSPLLCPIAMDADLEREYQRLRGELNRECGVPLRLTDAAWGGPVSTPSGCPDSELQPEDASAGSTLPRFFAF